MPSLEAVSVSVPALLTTTSCPPPGLVELTLSVRGMPPLLINVTLPAADEEILDRRGIGIERDRVRAGLVERGLVAGDGRRVVHPVRAGAPGAACGGLPDVVVGVGE